MFSSKVTRLGLPVLLAANAIAAGSPAASAESQFSSQPAPALIAFARTHHIPIETIDLGGTPRPPGKDDQVTLLFTLVRGEAREQWVATLTGDELNPTEAALNPQPKAVIYTFTGQKLQFERTRAALDIYLAGPFSSSATNQPSPEPRETRRRVLVTAEYLVHGIEPFCRSAMEVGPRMRARGWTDRDGYAAGFSPIPESALQVGRRFAERFQLTAEEERFENEAYLAMVSFFETARSIPEFDRLAKTAVERPSVWSMAKNFGLSTSMVFRWVDVKAVASGMISTDQPAYQFPLIVGFNQTVATRASLVVTAPRPPLHVTAGILAITADHPTDNTRHFIMRVIAARRGADRAQP